MNPSAFRCEWTPKEDIWKVAEQIRMEYWLEGTLPINVERIVEIKLKLDIIPTPGIYSVLDTDAWLQRNLQGIVVDQDSYLNPKFANRLRFSLAHELGHYFLHSSIYSGLQFNGLEEWKDFVENLPDAEYRGFEWQANEFAGRFLVPRDALVLGLEKAIQDIKANNLISLLEREPDLVLSRISPTICRLFGVSEQVIERRLEREGLWPCKLEQL